MINIEAQAAYAKKINTYLDQILNNLSDIKHVKEMKSGDAINVIQARILKGNDFLAPPSVSDDRWDKHYLKKLNATLYQCEDKIIQIQLCLRECAGNQLVRKLLPELSKCISAEHRYIEENYNLIDETTDMDTFRHLLADAKSLLRDPNLTYAKCRFTREKLESSISELTKKNNPELKEMIHAFSVLFSKYSEAANRTWMKKSVNYLREQGNEVVLDATAESLKPMQMEQINDRLKVLLKLRDLAQRDQAPEGTYKMIDKQIKLYDEEIMRRYVQYKEGQSSLAESYPGLEFPNRFIRYLEKHGGEFAQKMGSRKVAEDIEKEMVLLKEFCEGSNKASKAPFVLFRTADSRGNIKYRLAQLDLPGQAERTHHEEPEGSLNIQDISRGEMKRLKTLALFTEVWRTGTQQGVDMSHWKEILSIRAKDHLAQYLSFMNALPMEMVRDTLRDQQIDIRDFHFDRHHSWNQAPLIVRLLNEGLATDAYVLFPAKRTPMIEEMISLLVETLRCKEPPLTEKGRRGINGMHVRLQSREAIRGEGVERSQKTVMEMISELYPIDDVANGMILMLTSRRRIEVPLMDGFLLELANFDEKCRENPAGEIDYMRDADKLQGRFREILKDTPFSKEKMSLMEKIIADNSQRSQRLCDQLLSFCITEDEPTNKNQRTWVNHITKAILKHRPKEPISTILFTNQSTGVNLDQVKMLKGNFNMKFDFSSDHKKIGFIKNILKDFANYGISFPKQIVLPSHLREELSELQKTYPKIVFSTES